MRNMSAHEKIFAYAAKVEGDFLDISGNAVNIEIHRSTEKRNARALFDVNINVYSGNTDNDFRTVVTRSHVTMEEAMLLIEGFEMSVKAMAAFNPENVAINTNLYDMAA